MLLWMWVDDEREAPEDHRWMIVRTVEIAISWVKNPPCEGWEVISLDHDMGDETPGVNGSAVLKAIQEMVMTDDTYICPRILIHTANGSAHGAMKTMATRTMELARERGRLIHEE